MYSLTYSTLKMHEQYFQHHTRLYFLAFFCFFFFFIYHHRASYRSSYVGWYKLYVFDFSDGHHFVWSKITPADDTMNVRNRGSVSFDQFGHLQIPSAKITNSAKSPPRSGCCRCKDNKNPFWIIHWANTITIFDPAENSGKTLGLRSTHIFNMCLSSLTVMW